MKNLFSLLFLGLILSLRTIAQPAVFPTETISHYIGETEKNLLEGRIVILSEGLVVNRSLEVVNGLLIVEPGVIINGDVYIHSGASAIMESATITGSFRAEDAKLSILLNTTIGERLVANSVKGFQMEGGDVSGSFVLNSIEAGTVTTTQMHGDSVRIKAFPSNGNGPQNWSSLVGKGEDWLWFAPTLNALGTGWSFPPTFYGGGLLGERWLQMHSDSVALKLRLLTLGNGGNGAGAPLGMHSDSVRYNLTHNINSGAQAGFRFSSNTTASAVTIWDYEHLVVQGNTIGGDLTLGYNRHVDATSNEIGGKLQIVGAVQCTEEENDVTGYNSGCPCSTTGKVIGFVDLITDIDKGIIVSGKGNGNGNWDVDFTEPFLQEKGIQIGDKVCYKVAVIGGKPLGSDLRIVESE